MSFPDRPLRPQLTYPSRLDKNIFHVGLTDMQTKLDVRFYTTTLAFAHDLCNVITITHSLSHRLIM